MGSMYDDENEENSLSSAADGDGESLYNKARNAKDNFEKGRDYLNKGKELLNGKGAAQKGIQKGAEKGVQAAKKKAADEVKKEIVKKAAKEGGKVAAKAAVKAAAGAATGGVGLVVAEAVDVGIKFFKVIGAVLLIFIVIFCGGTNQNMTPGSTENSAETAFQNMDEDDHGFKAPRSENSEVFTDGDYDSIGYEYDYAHPNKGSCQQYLELIDKAIEESFKTYALETIKSMHKSCLQKIADIFPGSGWKYDDKKTMMKFYALRYPYVKEPYTVSGKKYYYSIGQFLNTVGCGAEYLPEYNIELTEKGFPTKIPKTTVNGYERINTDVDYAEIMSVFAQKRDTPSFDWQNCNLEDYEKFLMDPKTQSLFYEMIQREKVYTWVRKGTKTETDSEGNSVETGISDTCSFHWDTSEAGSLEALIELNAEGDPKAEEAAENSLVSPYDSIDESSKKYYYVFEVAPYGLRELYEMTVPEEDTDGHMAFRMAVKKHEKYHMQAESCRNLYFMNFQIINYSEQYLRTYLRYEADEVLGRERDDDSDILGPDSRKKRAITSLVRIYRENRDGRGSQQKYYTWKPEYEESASAIGIERNDGEHNPGRSNYYYLKYSLNMHEVEGAEWDNPDLPEPYDGEGFTPPDDSEMILDMPVYINQGGYNGPNGSEHWPWNTIMRGNSGESIQQAACLDTSYFMIYSYFMKSRIFRSHVEAWCQNPNYYMGPLFKSDVFFIENIPRLSQVMNVPFDFDTFRNEIKKGLPMIIHIRGTWVYNGVTYHRSSNGHFLVGMGYNSEGVYVYDPGTKNNSLILYDAWGSVADKYLRTFTYAGFTEGRYMSSYVKHYITDDGVSAPGAETSDDEINILAKIIHNEARGESVLGKQAVAQTVLNRVASKGSSIYAVCTSGAYDCSDKAGEISAECYEIARQAVNGSMSNPFAASPTETMYFCSYDNTTDSWPHDLNVRFEFTEKIGGHKFYKARSTTY